MAFAGASLNRAPGAIAVPARVALSAETGEGVDRLLALVEEMLTAAHDTLTIVIPSADGAARAWLHQRADVIEETSREQDVTVIARLSKKSQGPVFQGIPGSAH